MSQVSVTTTTPPVTVVCSRALFTTVTVVVAPTSVGQKTLDQCNGSDTTVESEEYNGVLLALPLCQSNYNLNPRCLLRHMPTMPWVLHRQVPLLQLSVQMISYFIWCLLWCLLSSFRFSFGCHFHQQGLSHWDLQHFNPSKFMLGRHMCFLVMICGPQKECIKWLLFPLF